MIKLSILGGYQRTPKTHMHVRIKYISADTVKIIPVYNPYISISHAHHHVINGFYCRSRNVFPVDGDLIWCLLISGGVGPSSTAFLNVPILSSKLWLTPTIMVA